MKKITTCLLVAALSLLAACEKFTEPTAFAPTFQLNDATDISRLGATLSGSITSNGGPIVEYGFTYGLYENLGNATDVPFEGAPSGRVETILTDLEPNTTYYYRLYAGSGASTVTSEVRSFRTNASDAPSLGRLTELDKNEQSMTVSCRLQDDGGYDIIMMGVAYRKSDSQKYALSILDEPTYEEFTLTVDGLEQGTSYMVCGFAISRGGIGYGEETLVETEDSEAPVVNTGEVNSYGGSWLVISGQQLSEGFSAVVERGFCYSSTSSVPTMSDGYVTADGTANEVFSARIDSLQGSATYYVRAFARNGTKTGYGKVVEVTTLPLTVPEVGATSVTDVTYELANFTSSVVGIGNGTLGFCGFCYSATETSPTLDNSTVLYATAPDETNAFHSHAHGLQSGTTYHVRAFVINEAGTGYGEAVEFTTINTYAPVLSAVSVTGVAHSSVQASCQVTDGGNRDITQYGFCWTTDGSEPTVDNCEGKLLLDGDGSDFIRTIENLRPDTSYKLRAFATNAVGTGYSEAADFHTEQDPVPGEEDNESPEM